MTYPQLIASLILCFGIASYNIYLDAKLDREDRYQADLHDYCHTSKHPIETLCNGAK